MRAFPEMISPLVYTARTTGRATGVIHTQSNDVSIATNCALEYQLGAEDRALHIADFQGRADDMIVSGGENIYPREVEQVLHTCPGNREAAVIGLPDDKWGSIISAFIVCSDPALGKDTVDRFCRESQKIAAFKRPRRFYFVDHLPINPTMVKDGSGWDAMAGVSAAFLAQDGFTGAPADDGVRRGRTDLGRSR
jgi:acyl-CoA synthetase (AMP-forming)/AMP-acid ligase II